MALLCLTHTEYAGEQDLVTSKTSTGHAAGDLLPGDSDQVALPCSNLATSEPLPAEGLAKDIRRVKA